MSHTAANTRVETLSNGLTVLVREDHDAPVAAFQVWIRTGSADESPAEAGLAHILEHMLFKGTARRGVGEIARDVEDGGGDINAWTSHDETVFHIVMPAHEFARGLDILSDAVLHPAFDPEELARELEVILEEIKRGDDSPERQVAEAIFSLVYTAHPYKDPVIGTVESVAGTTRERLHAFFARWYIPANMTLVLVGDFDAETALAAARAAFAEAPAKPLPARLDIKEPIQEAPRAHLIKGPVKQAHLAVAFPALSLHDPELPALEALAIALGQGESGRLIQLLERECALVNEVVAYPYAGLTAGLFGIDAELAPRNLLATLDALGREFRRATEEELAPAELAKAKIMAESEAVYHMQTMQGKARRLGYSQAMAGDVAFQDRYLDRLRELSASELVTAGRRVLVPERLNIALLWPDDQEAPTEAELIAAFTSAYAEGPREEALVDEAPEIAATPKPSHVAANRALPASDAHGVRRIVLENGLRILHKENRTVPLVTFQAGWQAGLRAEDDATNGAHSLISRLLTLGTQSRDAREIATTIDSLAGSLEGFSGRMSLGLRGTVLSRHAHPAFALFADCLSGAAFPDEEVETEKGFLIEEIEARDENPAQVAFELFAATLFKVHPFKRPLLGTRELAESFTPESLRALYAARRRAGNMVVSVVGDLCAEEAVALIEDAFGGWTKESAAPLPLVREPALAATREAYLPLEREQRHLVLGFFAPSLTDPDRYAFEVLNAAISGQGGRLFTTLRDRESLAYSVSSHSLNGLDVSAFATYIATSPQKRNQALAGLRRELERLRQGDLSQAEIDYAKRYLIGTHAIHLQTNSSQATPLLLNEAYGLGYDEHLRYRHAIERMTLAEVLDVARRTITPDCYALAEVGPKENPA